MNELQMIRSLLDKPAQSEAVAAAVRDRLRAETSRPGGATGVSHRRSRTFRSRWSIAGLGLAGVAATTAVAIAVAGSSTPGGPSSGTTALSGQAVLLAAAAKAEAAPAETGTYWHFRKIHEIPVRIRKGTDPYTMVELRLNEMWAPRNAAPWSGYRPVGARPKTPADAAAWRRDGSPARWDLGPSDAVNREHLFLSTRPQPGRLVKMVGPFTFSLAERQMSFAEIQKLPADPAALKAWMLKASADDEDGVDSAEARESFAAQSLSSLLSEVPAPPRVRAAAYRALAAMPNVRGLGEVKDERGRVGQGFLISHRIEDSRTDTRIVIDPVTSLVLSENVASMVKGRSTPAKERTTVILQVGWTNSRPQVPAVP